MLISEIFQSIQGEGLHAGTPSVFVRTSGCNLRCWFCDTPYTSWHPEGTRQSIDDIVEHVLSFDIEHTVITGGEPMLQPDVVELTQRLHEHQRFITIETAGTIDRPVTANLMSISPKRPNSTPYDSEKWAAKHEQLRDNPTVIRRFIAEYEHQFKFVIDLPEDVNDARTYLLDYPEVQGERVFLLPQSSDGLQLADKLTWLPELAKELGWQVSSRLHIEQFGNRRGT